MAGTGPQIQTVVFDLGNSCQCFGCRQKISRVLNKLKGIREHCYKVERNHVIVTGTVDVDMVIRRLSKVKKHARVAAFVRPPPLPENYNAMPPHPPYYCPDPPPPCCGQQGQPPLGNHNVPVLDQPPPPPPLPHHSVRKHFSEPPLAPACHCPPPPPHGGNGPPPPRHIPYCRDPPPSSACHCPPPQPDHNHAPPHCHRPPPNNATSQLDNFLHGPGSPLIPRNVRNAGILGQLANVRKLKYVELIKQKCIKLKFENGQVKAYNPTSYMQLPAGHDCPALQPPNQPPPRYVSPLSDENPNGPCTIL